MISVYLQPDITQLVQGKLKNKQFLEISRNEILNQSYLGAIDNDAADDLAYLFYDIKELLSNKRGEEIYIVLPDFYFYIDCFKTDNQSETKIEIEEQLKNTTGMVISDCYYSTPIITAPEPLEKMVTVCSIKRKIVDCLIDAAKIEDLHISSIEAASIAFLRGTMRFSKEEFVIHGYRDYATISGYSSIAGMFKMDIPELGIEKLGRMPKDEAEKQIIRTFIEFENTGIATFKYMNQDIPYVELMSPITINSFDSYKKRIAERKYFPENIQSHIDKTEQQEWIACAGTLLQSIDFTQDKYSEIIDSYEQILSGNVLPDEILKNTKAERLYQKTKSFCKIAISVMIITILTETIGIAFLDSITIPQALQTDYEAGQMSINDINAELNLIAQQVTEHEYPIEVFYKLLKCKPEGVFITAIEHGNENNAKDNNKQWIKIKAASADPLLFQNYIYELSGNDIFANVAVTQISNDNSGYKVADIVVGKGQ